MASAVSATPLNDVHDEEHDDEEVDHEANGENVIPSGGGEDSVDQGFVMAKLTGWRLFFQLSITETRQALKQRQIVLLSKQKCNPVF